MNNISLKSYIKEPTQYGNTKVIQQGNNPFVGYTYETGLINFENLVLFGDHTLSLYKPQEPVCISSDGIKGFTCNITTGKYLYNLLEVSLPRNEGYKRYSLILKDKQIFLSLNEEEQNRISSLLFKMDNLITLHQHK